jgi:amidase
MIDMRLFTTAVLAQEPWKYDSKVIPMPWRQSEADVIKPKLSSGGLTLGYTVVPWEPYKHPYAVDLINGIYAGDGGTDVFNTLKESGEPAIPNFGDLINPSLPKVDMNELWDIHLKKWAYQSKYLEQFRIFEEKHGKELDAIIAPITPTACIRHNQFKYYGYASTINLLDFTSVVVPVTFADKSIDKVNDSFKALTEIDTIVQKECKYLPLSSLHRIYSFTLLR